MIKFSVAVNGTTKGADTSFIGFTAFGKTAEFVNQWCAIGTKVAVQSRYKQGSYTNKDGKKVYTHDFIVETLEKLSGKANDEKDKEKDEFGFEPATDSLKDDGLPFA